MSLNRQGFLVSVAVFVAAALALAAFLLERARGPAATPFELAEFGGDPAGRTPRATWCAPSWSRRRSVAAPS